MVTGTPASRRAGGSRRDADGGIGPRAALTCGFTVLVMVLGGGGAAAPGSELVVELVAAAALVGAALLSRASDDARVPPGLLAFAGLLLLALPIAQLIPLPPALWRPLPGRAAEAAALDAIGAAARWMPLSESPARTLASLLALLPPLLALALASALGPRGRAALVLTIALVALVSVLLGALQLADGFGRTWRVYDDDPGNLNGFQANRNAQADVLLIGAAAAFAAAAASRRRIGARAARASALIVGAILLLGCVLTGSRTGVALAPLVLLCGVVAWRGWRARALIAGGALVAALGLAAPMLIARNRALEQVAERFSSLHDFRSELWLDTRGAIGAHWPAGSGVGTFKPIFVASERLVVVDPTLPVRAHNDYLEFVLEGGLAAVVILVTGFASLAWLVWRAARRAMPEDVPILVFCAADLAVVAIHSIVDYPLRSMALAHLAAVAAGTLAAIGGARQASAAREPGVVSTRKTQESARA